MTDSIRFLALLLLSVATLAVIPAAIADPAPGKQFSVEEPAQDNSVEAELASFKLADGFEINLFASEELGISNPIAIRWDPRGRLWVLCTWAYPQLRPGEPADDKLFILEDTDGDGVADKSVVFADGLNMPMGFELGDGGVYVGHAPELLYLRDNDGDDKADERRVILRGFGTGDTHQNINSFVWGPGGQLVFGQGLHAYSRVETPWGIARLDKAGIFRFWPRQLRLDCFLNGAMGPTNPWGSVYDDWGQPFMVSGAGRGVYYLTHGFVQTEHIEKFHPIALKNKLCGVDLIGTSHLPAEMQGNLVIGHFWTNQVDLFELTDDGAGFNARELPPLVQSLHKSFRPVDVRIGPDGAIYIADWFNPIVGHYQASFRHPDRDKTHGRIWRVTSSGRPLVERPDFTEAPLREVLNHLRSPERWTRYQAKRVLSEASTDDLIPVLRDWVVGLESDDPQYEHHLFEALGVFQSHHRPDNGVTRMLLAASDPRARAYAVRALGTHGAQWFGVDQTLELLETAIADEQARVRLEAVVALSWVSHPRSIEIAMRALDQFRDPFIDYVHTQAVHALKPQWKPVLERGELLFGGRIDHLAHLFRVDASDDIAVQVRALLESGRLDAASTETMLTVLANIGDEDDLRLVFDRATSRSILLRELAAVHDRRGIRPSGRLTGKVGELIDDPQADPEVRAAALRLAGRWNLKGLSGKARSIFEDESASAVERVEAIEAFAGLEERKGIVAVDVAFSTSENREVRLAALRALVTQDLALAADRTTMWLVEAGAGERDEVLAARILPVLSREGGAVALADALKKVELSTGTASEISQFLSARGRLDPSLQSELNRVMGIPEGQVPYDETFVRTLALEVSSKGDAQRGEEIYRRAELTCVACHRIGSEGGILGPDLSGIGRGLSSEVIIESVLWPKRQIKEGFLSTTITTRDGRMLTGYLQKEDREIVSIRDLASNQEVILGRREVKARQDAGSIMPAGLTASLSREELRDLIAYLASLGKE